MLYTELHHTNKYFIYLLLDTPLDPFGATLYMYLLSDTPESEAPWRVRPPRPFAPRRRFPDRDSGASRTESKACVSISLSLYLSISLSLYLSISLSLCLYPLRYAHLHSDQYLLTASILAQAIE